MVEIYWAYQDFKDMMALTEDIISSIVFEVHGKYEIPYGETTLDFKAPWRKLSMTDSVWEVAGIDIYTHSVEDLREARTTVPARGLGKTKDSSGVPCSIL